MLKYNNDKKKKNFCLILKYAKKYNIIRRGNQWLEENSDFVLRQHKLNRILCYIQLPKNK